MSTPIPPTPSPEIVIHAGSKVSLSLVALMVAQLATGVWAISSFWTEQKEMGKRMGENFSSIAKEIGDLKLEIYTRKEAAIQFESIRQEGIRQNERLKELSSEVSEMRRLK